MSDQTCLCGRPIPPARPPRTTPKGTFTLEQVEPMLLKNRGPKPGGAA